MGDNSEFANHLTTVHYYSVGIHDYEDWVVIPSNITYDDIVDQNKRKFELNLYISFVLIFF